MKTVIGALVVAGFAGSGAAFANITDDRFEQKTQERLAELDIAESDVKSIRQVLLRRKNDRGPDIRGAESWVRLNACDGYLVIQMNRAAFVKQTYTTGNCAVPGVSSF
ncbi:hypothetical protein HBA54_13700 [Pelagibius litoralis]|uniref:SmpA / OmlA family protein n=1 Tax=Pelagibius litoralis TaxID=374515 RepID=A0A967EYB0_9PROT|nr:hypothetical protein [Pelagibius litoralis]NIA69651.1 hypothetical protein [Pelagibius litoralis]